MAGLIATRRRAASRSMASAGSTPRAACACRRSTGASAMCSRMRGCSRITACAATCSMARRARHAQRRSAFDEVVRCWASTPLLAAPTRRAFRRRTPARGARSRAAGAAAPAAARRAAGLARCVAARGGAALSRAAARPLRDSRWCYVSHQFDEVLRLATHLVVMDQGRVAAAGDVGAVSLRLRCERSSAPMRWARCSQGTRRRGRCRRGPGDRRDRRRPAAARARARHCVSGQTRAPAAAGARPDPRHRGAAWPVGAQSAARPRHRPSRHPAAR